MIIKELIEKLKQFDENEDVRIFTHPNIYESSAKCIRIEDVDINGCGGEVLICPDEELLSKEDVKENLSYLRSLFEEDYY